MEIKVRCDACEATLRTPETVRGQTVPCPLCGQPIQVPLVENEHVLKLELIDDGEAELRALLGEVASIEKRQHGKPLAHTPGGYSPGPPAAELPHGSADTSSPQETQASDSILALDLQKKRWLIIIPGFGAGIVGLIVMLSVAAFFKDLIRGEPTIKHNGWTEYNRGSFSIRLQGDEVYLPRRIWMKTDGEAIVAMLHTAPSGSQVELLTADSRILTVNRHQLDAIDNSYLNRFSSRWRNRSVSSTRMSMAVKACMSVGGLLFISGVFFLPGGLMIWYGKHIIRTQSAYDFWKSLQLARPVPAEVDHAVRIGRFVHGTGWSVAGVGAALIGLAAFRTLMTAFNWLS